FIPLCLSTALRLNWVLKIRVWAMQRLCLAVPVVQLRLACYIICWCMTGLITSAVSHTLLFPILCLSHLSGPYCSPLLVWLLPFSTLLTFSRAVRQGQWT